MMGEVFNAPLSDADRTDALNRLAQAVGEGRLSITEFEQRSDDIIRARTRGDLLPIFRDVPTQRTQELKVYSQGDVDRAREAARKPKLATALVGTIGLGFGSVALVAAAAASDSVALGIGGLGLLALIPVLWILLYVAKVGPAQWHAPSARQVERQRQREVRAMTALQRAEQKELESQMWAQRRQQAGEIAGEAMDFAKRKFEQWK